MNQNQKIGIYIFRRDLRLYDNLGLLELQKNVDIIIPIFILDVNKIMVSQHNKYYFSNNAVQFICESLIDLNNYLIKFDSCLRLFYGRPYEAIHKILKWVKKELSVNSSNIYVCYNADYSEYALKRDKLIDNICSKHDVHNMKIYDDYCLMSFDKLVKSDGSAFRQFGAFYKHAIVSDVNKPIKSTFKNYLGNKFRIVSEYKVNELGKFYSFNEKLAQNGGRINALKHLKNLKNFKDYNEQRNKLDYNTTNVSAYLNAGCVSIREVYHTIKYLLGSSSDLLKQLFWRDFYLQALRYIPNGNKYTYMDPRYNNIKWQNSGESWKKLINAQTGFLLIDSAMNEMKITGFMHNRARMMVGSFWIKYLLIDVFHPKYGSQVGFSKFLCDAIGTSQNKFNNQWLSEFDYSGRKFAPKDSVLSGRPMNISNNMISKFDHDCVYIKKWLPYLKDISNKELIKWDDEISKKYKIHPAPMFDPVKKYQEWINACRNL